MNELSIMQLLSSLVYGLMGLGLFLLTLWFIEKITPYSIEKEITEKHNIALGIVVAAIIISLGLIYSAAIR